MPIALMIVVRVNILSATTSAAKMVKPILHPRIEMLWLSGVLFLLENCLARHGQRLITHTDRSLTMKACQFRLSCENIPHIRQCSPRWSRLCYRCRKSISWVVPSRRRQWLLTRFSPPNLRDSWRLFDHICCERRCHGRHQRRRHRQRHCDFPAYRDAQGRSRHFSWASRIFCIGYRFKTITLLRMW